MNKIKKTIIALLLIFVASLTLGVLCACQSSPDGESEQYADIYSAYITYAQSNGDTSLSYEEWVDIIEKAMGNDSWTISSSDPEAESGKTGDLYLNGLTFDLFQKNSDGWQKIKNIKENGETAPPAKQTVNVTFDVNGGDALKVTKLEIKSGETVNLPAPKRFGYYFRGWYNGTQENAKKITPTTPIENDIALYAGWKKAPKQATYAEQLLILTEKYLPNVKNSEEYTVLKSYLASESGLDNLEEFLDDYTNVYDFGDNYHEALAQAKSDILKENYFFVFKAVHLHELRNQYGYIPDVLADVFFSKDISYEDYPAYIEDESFCDMAGILWYMNKIYDILGEAEYQNAVCDSISYFIKCDTAKKYSAEATAALNAAEKGDYSAADALFKGYYESDDLFFYGNLDGTQHIPQLTPPTAEGLYAAFNSTYYSLYSWLQLIVKYLPSVAEQEFFTSFCTYVSSVDFDSFDSDDLTYEEYDAFWQDYFAHQMNFCSSLLDAEGYEEAARKALEDYGSYYNLYTLFLQKGDFSYKHEAEMYSLCLIENPTLDDMKKYYEETDGEVFMFTLNVQYIIFPDMAIPAIEHLNNLRYTIKCLINYDTDGVYTELANKVLQAIDYGDLSYANELLKKFAQSGADLHKFVLNFYS